MKNDRIYFPQLLRKVIRSFYFIKGSPWEYASMLVFSFSFRLEVGCRRVGRCPTPCQRLSLWTPPKDYSFGIPFVFAFYSPKPKLIDNAVSTLFIEFRSSSPILSPKRFLSMVRICSSKTILSRARPHLSALTSI